MFILLIFQLDAFIAANPPRPGRETNGFNQARLAAQYNREWHNVNREPIRQWLEANQPTEPVQFGGPTFSSSHMALYNMFRNQNGRQNQHKRPLPRLYDEDFVDDFQYDEETFGKPDNHFLDRLFQ